MIKACQCNCCITRNRHSTTDLILKLDGVAAYNKEEPSSGDLERLHQHNIKLQSELKAEKNKVSKLKELLLLTDPVVSDVEVGTTQVKQHQEFLKCFPDERTLITQFEVPNE